MQVYKSNSLSSYSLTSLTFKTAFLIFDGKVFKAILSLIIIFKIEPCRTLLIT